jgi:hypothetical protein
MNFPQISAFQHQVSDTVGLRLLTGRQVSDNLFIKLVSDIELEMMGLKTAKKKQRNAMQFVQSQNQGKIYVNNQILEAPDGVYTWILYKVDSKTILVSCPVQTLMEYTNRHTIINYIAYKHGIIKNQNISSDVHQSQKSFIYYGGEFKKNGNDLEFNFQSGTYSVPNKFEMEKNPKFNKTLTQVENIWCEHFLTCLQNFGFDTSKTHYVDFEDKTSPQSTFIKYKNIPFIAENYIKMQPYIEGRWIIGSNKKELNDLKKKITSFQNAYIQWEGLIRIPEFKNEKKPVFECSLPFLDEIQAKQHKKQHKTNPKQQHKTNPKQQKQKK